MFSSLSYFKLLIQEAFVRLKDAENCAIKAATSQTKNQAFNLIMAVLFVEFPEWLYKTWLYFLLKS